MIERMKKITILLHNRDKKRTLAKLQNLGLVHLDTKESIIGDKLRKLQKKKQIYESILTKISKLAEKYSHELPHSPLNPGVLTDEKSIEFPGEIKTFHQRMLYLEDKFSKLEEEYMARDELRANYEVLKPWGEFDWEKMERLEDNGIRYGFFLTTENEYNLLDSNTKENLFPIHREMDLVYLLWIHPKESSGSIDDSDSVTKVREREPSFEKLDLPKMRLTELRENQEVLERSIRKDELTLARFHQEADSIRREIDGIQVLMDFEQAKISLDNDSHAVVFAITGYLPVADEKTILKFLNEEKISYQIDRPSLEDSVPIKLKNNRFAKAFEPITRIFALPHYAEIDPTAFFAPFFALFFGLCLGDIGYGAILLLLSTIAYFKVKQEHKLIPMLLIFLSISTLFSGVLLNTFFGEAFFKVPGSEFYIMEEGGEFALFSAYTKDGKTIYPAMTLALVLGFVQLSFGIFLQAINMYKANRSFLYSIKPLAVIGIIWGGTIIAVHKDFLDLGFNQDFSVGIFSVGEWLVQIPVILGKILFYSGVIMFFLFNNPDKKFLIRPVFGIWEAYNFIIGFSGDFLSYVRLFALGLASGLLGNAFNQVAFMILPDGNIATPLFAITLVIMVLGHVLNIALSVLGSFVHPLRLTFVEFYKNMNFVGGGREFKPFSVLK